MIRINFLNKHQEGSDLDRAISRSSELDRFSIENQTFRSRYLELQTIISCDSCAGKLILKF
ncbi:hypothetical protein RchiOBHm_Chr2g0162541 [Rosa chinensis]|uniref:Uncharacterized protein n=1 Tax=Rosa chinensis TaxID=74649 RepID=A0A2P6S312_ROSCH|nr:hypothetical protein RchiOBHm_Chr2g0162541 [Rosa chinensis]